ncbi:MAG: hypothetical protein CBC29_06545 [Methylococcaceae bacterium TMED69]|nr:MAG: hypothetical protein CBC29_06545 [Methylococcaceae bacterium TMED69]
MMTTGLFMLIFNATASDPSGDLKRNMKALELYLQDQEDYEEHCPELKWDQPDIDVYKKELTSQLPEGCKK